MRYPVCDLHIHSIASGHAFNTIDEIIRYAQANKYHMIGISDHGPDMDRAPHLGYFEMLYRLPRRVGKMTVLYGCEANIIDTRGHIDIPDELVSSMDYIIAGLHRRTSYSGLTRSDHTTALLAAIRSKKVDIVPHPISMNFTVDPERIIRAALDENVILECNVSVLKEAIRHHNEEVIQLTSRLIKMASEAGVVLLLGSDAHHISEMGISDDDYAVIEDVYGISLLSMKNADPLELMERLTERKRMRNIVFNER